MYDARTEPHEFTGDGRAEAVAKACEFFGLEESELAVAELESAEVYGAAGRTVVVAVPRSRPTRAPEGGRGRGGPRREARGEPRSEGRRGDRGERRRGERGGGRRGEGRRERAEQEAPQLSDEPSVGTPQGELGELGEFVLGLVERMQIGPFEISESAEEGLVVCGVRGPAAAHLSAGDGRAVDAIALLANQAAVRLSEDPPRVVIDVEGDAEAREARLTKLAHRVAGRARDTGRAVAVDPMNGRDRRVIHLALRDEPDVATMSIGEGSYRQVVVVPAGAPEYEEARRESESAAARSDEG